MKHKVYSQMQVLADMGVNYVELFAVGADGEEHVSRKHFVSVVREMQLDITQGELHAILARFSDHGDVDRIDYKYFLR